MPEFDFRLSLAEWDGVVDYIFEQGAYIVSNEQYPTPDVVCMRNKTEYEGYIKEQRIIEEEAPVKFHILRDDYLVCPLQLNTTVKNNGKRIYYLSDRTGGPSILILYFTSVKTGICTYYPYYFYEEVEYWKHRPPEGLVNLYKDIFKYIRKRTVIIKYFGSRKYCGYEYLQQVRDGIIPRVKDEFKALVMEYFNSEGKK